MQKCRLQASSVLHDFGSDFSNIMPSESEHDQSTEPSTSARSFNDNDASKECILFREIIAKTMDLRKDEDIRYEGPKGKATFHGKGHNAWSSLINAALRRRRPTVYSSECIHKNKGLRFAVTLAQAPRQIWQDVMLPFFAAIERGSIKDVPRSTRDKQVVSFSLFELIHPARSSRASDADWWREVQTLVQDVMEKKSVGKKRRAPSDSDEKLVKLTKRNDEREVEMVKLKRDLRETDAKVGLIKTELATTIAELAATKAELATTKTDLAVSKTDCSTAKAKLITIRVDLDEKKVLLNWYRQKEGKKLDQPVPIGTNTGEAVN